MKFKEEIQQLFPELTYDKHIGDFFDIYVILFTKLKQLGMVSEDFSSELGLFILENSIFQNGIDEEKDILIQQIASIKIKQAFNAVFHSIDEVHEENIAHIKEKIDTEIENSIELNPDDFKDMEIDVDFENKINKI